MNRCAIAWTALLMAACDPAPSVAGGWCQYPVDCHAPLACSFSRCRPPCTMGSECPGTNLCIAGHCAVPEDRGCETIPGRTCASALDCAEDHCTLRCTTSCAGGGTCRPATDQPFSICVDPSAPTPDAALSIDGG